MRFLHHFLILYSFSCNNKTKKSAMFRYANHLASSSGQGGVVETSPESEVGGVRGAQGRRDKSRERGHSAERKHEEKNSRRLVHELEMKNAEIMREIARLRQNRATVADMERGAGRGGGTELETLRMRKVELEFRLNELQETRKDLMSELEELMKVRPSYPHNI